MASEITKAIYGLTSEDKPVTVAGIGYLLRNDFIPQLAAEEIDRSLEWLLRNRYVVANPSQGFGTEYLRKPRE